MAFQFFLILFCNLFAYIFGKKEKKKKKYLDKDHSRYSKDWLLLTIHLVSHTTPSYIIPISPAASATRFWQTFHSHWSSDLPNLNMMLLFDRGRKQKRGIFVKNGEKKYMISENRVETCQFWTSAIIYFT